MWRNLVHCWWECERIQPLWKTVWRLLLKTKKKTTIGVRYLSKETEVRISKRYLQSCVYCSTPHNHQDTKTKVHSKGWLNKENVVCTCNGILFSLLRKGRSFICSNRDEPGEHYAKGNKPETQRQILYDLLLSGF